MPRRKKISHHEPIIEPEELRRLEALLAQEVKADHELKQEMHEIISSRDRALNKELKRLEERNKKLIMWIGVILIMVIIAIFWVSNMLATIKPKTDLTAVDTKYDVEEIRRNLTETMGRVVSDIDELKQQAAQLDKSSGTPALPTANQSPIR